MIYRILLVSLLAGLLSAQNSFGNNNNIPCGFDVADRCNGCCQSYALWGGLSTERASGFPAADGRTCICCTSNNNCRG